MSSTGTNTAVIRTQGPRGDREHATSIYMTSSYVFESAEHARAMFAGEEEGAIYSRYSNANLDELIARMCILEHAEDGVAVASGMSAIFTTLAALTQKGDHILASRALFGSTFQLLTQIFPKWGITTTMVAPTDLSAWAAAIEANRPKVVMLESPSNPGLELVDIRAVAEMAHAVGALVLVDNVFATPVLQAPLTLGADVVMHSTTKYLDGQGRSLGGVIMGSRAHIEPIRFMARHSGPALSPFNAWLVSRSLEHLSLRVHRHAESALAVAGAVADLPGVQWVRYPYLSSHPQYALAQAQMCMGGGVFTFEVAGGAARAMRVVDRVAMISRSANLGDTRTIITHPATTTHRSLTPEERAKVGISDGMLRVSVGLEDVVDILSDLEQAIQASRRNS